MSKLSLERTAAEFAEDVELFGREHAPDSQFGQSAQLDLRGLGRGEFKRTLPYGRLVGRVSVDGLVEGAAGGAQARGRGAALRRDFAADRVDLPALFGREVQRAQQPPVLIYRPARAFVQRLRRCALRTVLTPYRLRPREGDERNGREPG